jgi:hypothetical protein
MFVNFIKSIVELKESTIPKGKIARILGVCYAVVT